MGPPVLITTQALHDLRSIASYIAQDDPEIAIRFGDALIDQALGLSSFPQMGRVVPEIGDPSIREIAWGNYRIVYRVRTDPARIEVLRFWHGARGEPVVQPRDD